MHTKSLLALSTGGIAVLSTILFRLKIQNELIFSLSALAITLFLLSGFYCLQIFERNAERVEAELDVFFKRVNIKENQKKREEDQKKILEKKNITINKLDKNLKRIGSYAKMSFNFGIICSVFIVILVHHDLTKEGNTMNKNEENVTPDPKENENQIPDERPDITPDPKENENQIPDERPDITPDPDVIGSDKLEFKESFYNLDKLRPGDDANFGTPDSPDIDSDQSEPDQSGDTDNE